MRRASKPINHTVALSVNAQPYAELESLADQEEASAIPGERAETFFSKRLMKPISLALLIAFFNQLSGINAILYFAPAFFK